MPDKVQALGIWQIPMTEFAITNQKAKWNSASQAPGGSDATSDATCVIPSSRPAIPGYSLLSVTAGHSTACHQEIPLGFTDLTHIC